MTAARERRLALALVAAGVVLLAVSLPFTWTTVPAALTGGSAPVELTGQVLFEDGQLHALVVAALLVGLWRWDGWRRAAAAVVVVLVTLVWLGQALERAVEPAQAAAASDRGPELLGLADLEDREVLRRLPEAELPVTGWPWLAVGGSLVTAAGAVLVLSRARRWDDAGSVPTEWWAG